MWRSLHELQIKCWWKLSHNALLMVPQGVVPSTWCQNNVLKGSARLRTCGHCQHLPSAGFVCIPAHPQKMLCAWEVTARQISKCSGPAPRQQLGFCLKSAFLATHTPVPHQQVPSFGKLPSCVCFADAPYPCPALALQPAAQGLRPVAGTGRCVRAWPLRGQFYA